MLERSFIVRRGSRIFDVLRKYSFTSGLLWCVRRIANVEKGTERDYALTECVVLFDLAIAVSCWLSASWIRRYSWELPVDLFAVGVGLRLYDIIVYHINVVLFDGYRKAEEQKLHDLRGYRRMIICLLVNYVSVLFWFAVLYQIFEGSFVAEAVCVNSRVGSLYLSVITMTTLGYGDIRPMDNWGAIICMIQTLMGMFLVIVMLAAFIRLLPKPGTKDEYEQWELNTKGPPRKNNAGD